MAALDLAFLSSGGILTGNKSTPSPRAMHKLFGAENA